MHPEEEAEKQKGEIVPQCVEEELGGRLCVLKFSTLNIGSSPLIIFRSTNGLCPGDVPPCPLIFGKDFL